MVSDPYLEDVLKWVSEWIYISIVSELYLKDVLEWVSEWIYISIVLELEYVLE